MPLPSGARNLDRASNDIGFAGGTNGPDDSSDRDRSRADLQWCDSVFVLNGYMSVMPSHRKYLQWGKFRPVIPPQRQTQSSAPPVSRSLVDQGCLSRAGFCTSGFRSAEATHAETRPGRTLLGGISEWEAAWPRFAGVD